MDDIIITFKFKGLTTTINRSGVVKVVDENNNQIDKYMFTFINELYIELKFAKNQMDYLYRKTIDDDTYLIVDNITYYGCLNLIDDIKIMLKKDELTTLSIIDDYNKQYEIDQRKLYEATHEGQIETLVNRQKKINIDNEQEANIEDAPIIDLTFSDEIGERFSKLFGNSFNCPDAFEISDLYQFVGQLNLADIKKDPSGLLPNTGYLYFFCGLDHKNYGKVIYTTGDKLVLKDTTPFDGMDTSFYLENQDIIYEDIPDEFDSRILNDCEDTSNKMLGFMRNCEYNGQDLLKMYNKYVVLLQIGTDILNGCSMTFLIEKKDLINRYFNNIIYVFNDLG